MKTFSSYSPPSARPLSVRPSHNIPLQNPKSPFTVKSPAQAASSLIQPENKVLFY